MKNFIVLTIFFLISFLAVCQSFQKGNYDLKAGLGAGIFSIETNDPADSSIQGIGMITINYPVQFHYSIRDKWSLGFSLAKNHIITNIESNNVYANLNHIGAIVQYRVANEQDDAINLDASFGYTGFSWNDKKRKEKISGDGSFFQLGASYNHYFTNVSGIYFNFNFVTIELKDIKNTYNQHVTYGFGAYQLAIFARGISLGTGICLKF
ncbi:MAG: hypothetical protein ABIJ97_04415 [Bacteroidota bacterium]